jgi:hypothetical protein
MRIVFQEYALAADTLTFRGGKVEPKLRGRCGISAVAPAARPHNFAGTVSDLTLNSVPQP